jgi:hypothetical protein
MNICIIKEVESKSDLDIWPVTLRAKLQRTNRARPEELI